MEHLHYFTAASVFFGLLRIWLIDVTTPPYWQWDGKTWLVEFGFGAVTYPVIAIYIVASVGVALFETLKLVYSLFKNPFATLSKVYGLDEKQFVERLLISNAEFIKKQKPQEN